MIEKREEKRVIVQMHFSFAADKVFAEKEAKKLSTGIIRDDIETIRNFAIARRACYRQTHPGALKRYIDKSLKKNLRDSSIGGSINSVELFNIKTKKNKDGSYEKMFSSISVLIELHFLIGSRCM